MKRARQGFCIAGVITGTEPTQFVPGGFGDLQRIDELRERSGVDTLSPGQVLELFIRLFDAVTAHDRLDRLGEHFRVGCQIGIQRLRVELKFW